jgi:hypothetical protein
MKYSALALLSACSAVSAVADPTLPQDRPPMMQSFESLKWEEMPDRPGMQSSHLTGNPKAGPYTQMRKVSAGTNNPLHSHSSGITNVVISGVWYTGTDDATAKNFGRGSVIFMPGGWLHVSGCRPGSDCVLYQAGDGKFDFNPASTSGQD